MSCAQGGSGLSRTVLVCHQAGPSAAGSRCPAAGLGVTAGRCRKAGTGVHAPVLSQDAKAIPQTHLVCAMRDTLQRRKNPSGTRCKSQTLNVPSGRAGNPPEQAESKALALPWELGSTAASRGQALPGPPARGRANPAPAPPPGRFQGDRGAQGPGLPSGFPPGELGPGAQLPSAALPADGPRRRLAEETPQTLQNKTKQNQNPKKPLRKS